MNFFSNSGQIRKSKTVSLIALSLFFTQIETGFANPPDAPEEKIELGSSCHSSNGLQVIGENTLAQLDPESRQRLLEIIQKLSDAARESPGEVTPAMAAHLNDALRVVTQPMPERSSELVADSNLAQPVESASLCSRWKKRVAGACAAVSTLSCAAGGCLLQHPWIRAGMLTTTGSILYGASGILGQAISLPARWNYFSRLLIRSLVGSALVFPGNMFVYAGAQIGLEPGSTVNLIALRSMSVFVATLTGMCGNVVFLDQPTNWPLWVGIVMMGGITALQTWYAIDNPVAH